MRPSRYVLWACLVALILLFSYCSSVSADDGEQVYRAYARTTAVSHGLDPDAFEQQLYVESRYDPNAFNRSGACGIAQIVPVYHPGVNCWDPYESMDYAAGLMEQYLEKFGSYRLALAAYQAGESSVVSARGVPRIPETVWYIDSVLSPDD